MMTPLVSVITPSFNSEEFIGETLYSLQKQTFSDWEICITDDCSSDRTRDIIREFSKKDSRIRLFELNENSGAAVARNNSLSMARGRFIAYLDADDVWYPNKLEMQVSFMTNNKIGFSCSSYEVIGLDGMPLGRNVKMLDKCDYVGFLTHNLLQTVGIMVDTSIIDKSLLIMPKLKRRQDAATWLQILKAGYECYGIPEILCGYRRVPNSLSSDKKKAAKGVWNLYRNVEKLSLPFSLYCFMRYAALAIWKRLYRK